MKSDALEKNIFTCSVTIWILNKFYPHIKTVYIESGVTTTSGALFEWNWNQVSQIFFLWDLQYNP